jgi:hypothetical protein
MEPSTSRVEPEDPHSRVGRVLERVPAGYHRTERHGGADRVTTSLLDGLLATTPERAFGRADRLPPDAEVIQIRRWWRSSNSTPSPCSPTVRNAKIVVPFEAPDCSEPPRHCAVSSPPSRGTATNCKQHSGPTADAGPPLCGRGWPPGGRGRRLNGTRPGDLVGVPHGRSRRSCARAGASAVARQAPEPAQGRVLHGTGLVPRRGAMERSSGVHPSAAGQPCAPGERPHLGCRPRRADRVGSVGDPADQRRSARNVQIALRAATAALPIVAADRQRVLAVSVLSAERVLDVLDGRPAGSLEERSRWALAQVPHAADWARSFAREIRSGSTSFHRHAAPNTVRYAVVAIAQAYVPDRDGILRDLLAGAIGGCAQLSHRDAPPATTSDTAAWEAACQLIETAVGKASAR